MTKIEALELELAARKMVKGTELEWWSVIKWGLPLTFEPLFDGIKEHYELALGIVEGKPMWKGDVHYDSEGVAHETCGTYSKGYLATCTWNPPKPKTVMVELEYDVVMHAAGLRPDISPALTRACRKALKELQ